MQTEDQSATIAFPVLSLSTHCILEILFDMSASDVTHSYIVLPSPCLKTEEKAVLRVACFPVMQFCNDNFVILSGHADVHDHSAIS